MQALQLLQRQNRLAAAGRSDQDQRRSEAKGFNLPVIERENFVEDVETVLFQ